MLVEAVARDHAVVEVGLQIAQIGRHPVPIVERRLQGRRDMRRVGAPGEIVRHHDELAVASLLQAGQFHARSLLVRRP